MTLIQIERNIIRTGELVVMSETKQPKEVKVKKENNSLD